MNNDKLINYMKEQKAKLEAQYQEEVKDLAKELEQSAKKFMAIAERVRSFEGTHHFDENLIQQNTMWVEVGIKRANKLYEQLDALRMLNMID